MDYLALSVILPLFAIMVAGYLVARFRLLADGASEVLSRFVFVVALPALIFTSLTRISVAEFFNWQYIAVLGGGMLAMFVIAMAVSRFVFPGNLLEHSLYRPAADSDNFWRRRARTRHHRCNNHRAGV